MFTANDVLDYLEDGTKWFKGGFADEHGCVCVYGAVCQLENEKWELTHDKFGKLTYPESWNASSSKLVLAQIADVIKSKFPNRVIISKSDEEEVYNNTGWVARFNDHDDTTWEDVKSVLLEAGKVQ